jgi:hypothetical protein
MRQPVSKGMDGCWSWRDDYVRHSSIIGLILTDFLATPAQWIIEWIDLRAGWNCSQAKARSVHHCRARSKRLVHRLFHKQVEQSFGNRTDPFHGEDMGNSQVPGAHHGDQRFVKPANRSAIKIDSATSRFHHMGGLLIGRKIR